jgi:hypothetical protein
MSAPSIKHHDGKVWAQFGPTKWKASSPFNSCIYSFHSLVPTIQLSITPSPPANSPRCLAVTIGDFPGRTYRVMLTFRATINGKTITGSSQSASFSSTMRTRQAQLTKVHFPPELPTSFDLDFCTEFPCPPELAKTASPTPAPVVSPAPPPDPRGQHRRVVGFIGIKNTLINCYMSAVVQVLFPVPDFQKTLLSPRPHRSRSPRASKPCSTA